MHLEGNVCTAGNKRPSNVHGRDCSSWARRHQSFKHQHMRAIAVLASNNVTCKQVTNSNQPICRTANSPRAVLQLTDMQASWTPDTRREHADREHDQTWETGNMQAGRLRQADSPDRHACRLTRQACMQAGNMMTRRAGCSMQKLTCTRMQKLTCVCSMRTKDARARRQC